MHQVENLEDSLRFIRNVVGLEVLAVPRLVLVPLLYNLSPERWPMRAIAATDFSR